MLLPSCELNCNPQVLDDESWIESRRQVFTILVFNCLRCKDRLITGCCWCTLKAFLFGGYGKQSSPSIRDKIWVWLRSGVGARLFNSTPQIRNPISFLYFFLIGNHLPVANDVTYSSLVLILLLVQRNIFIYLFILLCTLSTNICISFLGSIVRRENLGM